MPSSQLNVVIVGAGPYGLSLATYLRAQRIPFRIFGSPMSSWREHMPQGMSLKSEGFASNIYDPEGSFTLARFCRDAGLPYSDVGDPVALQTFVAYGLEFQRRLVPELDTSAISSIKRSNGGYRVKSETGEVVESKCVVIATGISHLSHTPDILSAFPSDIVSHSSAHSDLSRFRDTVVAVIGAGASAVDIAALLHEQGAKVHLIARAPSVEFHEPSIEPRPILERMMAPRSGLGVGWRSKMCTDLPLLFRVMPERFRLRVVKRHLGPAPGWFMKDRVVGQFPVHVSTEIDALTIRDGRAHLQTRQRGQRSEIVVDHVIAATGYKADVDRLTFIDEELRRQISRVDRAPVLTSNFESSAPHFYFVGLASANCFGPLARFAYGARFAAARLSRRLAHIA